MPTTPIQHVIICIAMEAEAAPLIQHLGLKLEENFFPPQVPFHAFTGTYDHDKNHKVTVVTNGKDHVYETGVDNCGTVPAAMASFLALQKIEEQHTADLVVNAGTCGGFQRKGAAIGDVFLTTHVVHHDRRIPIPDFVPYGVGKLECINAQQLADFLDFKLGICTTGNSLDKTEEDEKHMLAHDASVKDMEAAAIAWSCELFNKPFMGVKVVTDIVDGHKPTQEEFLENLHTAAKSLQYALPKLLEYIFGKHHHEL